MTEPETSYEDYYPPTPPTGLTETEEHDYAAYYPTISQEQK